MKKHIYFIIFALCHFPVRSNSQELFSSGYNISYITMDKGLLHNFIDDIYKDKQGFLWISTGGGGLSRYDGYEFTNYNTDSAPVKLKSNFIANTCEDDFNRLWIVSEGGINIIDLTTMRQVIPCDSKHILSTLLNQPAESAMKDSKGCMWVYCRNALNKICFDEKGNVRDIFSLPHELTGVKAIALQDIDEDGDIWAGLHNRICKIHQTETGSLKAMSVIPSLQMEEDILISALILKENEVWIGTDRGLIRYDRNRGNIKWYTHDRLLTQSLSQNHVTDLAVTGNRQLIVSTLMGINIYNPISDDFEHIVQDDISSGVRLNSNFVNCLLPDGGIIWIGTETGGINKMSVKKLSVKNYVYDKRAPSSLSPNPVNAVYEDEDGYLWVGTVEGGLNRKSPENDSFTHYTVESSSQLSHNSVSAVTADNNRRLWVGTWGSGVTLLDRNYPERPALAYISHKEYPGSYFVGALCFDSINNGIWIGCNPGVFFYDMANNRLSLPFDNSDDIMGVIGAVIDRKGRLWMGCLDGLYIIDLKSRSSDRFSYRYLHYKLDNPESRLIEKISCFCLTDKGELWLGSNGYGIYKYIENGKGESFVSYTTKHGLINNNIRGILEDDEGRLWISSNNGLSCFDRVNNRFTNYTGEDGLPENQFYWNAYCRSSKGLLYFGGLNGLVAIDANRLVSRNMNCKVTLTKLHVGNKDILAENLYTDVDISRANSLRLHERDKSFSLEFSALNYKPQLSAIYSYRLEGFDEQWIETPATRRFASYTNLPPGEYVFKVKYIPEGTSGNDAPITELKVTVKPFFYKTAWFLSIVGLIIACCVLYFHDKQTRRTKEKLDEMSKKVQEMTVDKLSFFTNITHEFRTPITLITGPIERALRLSSNPQVIEQLNFVQRNSKYLLSLVNQLMDFRKIESGKMEIVKTEGNFIEFVETLLLPFEAFAGERNIRIYKYFRMASPYILFDKDAMQKVINNLMSNAVKFTPDGGTVSIYVASFTCRKTGEKQLYTGVKDTGAGIDEHDIDKVFERFYQARNNIKYPVYGQSGTGIGLYLSKYLVELHGGKIGIRNNRKTGCLFYITIPAIPAEMQNSALLQPADNDSPEQNKFDFAPDKLTILVVDDNVDMRLFIRSILSEHYNILEAGNGVEALSLSDKYNVDFIITDLMMPVMDGMELSRKVKENFAISHIPILILTAKTSTESRIDSYRIGVDDYLLKPFDEGILLARIANILENRKRFHRLFAASMRIDDLPIEEESSDKKFINKALGVIKENYKNPYYEISDFIEAMNISKSLLNKKLQSLVGQSTGQFIRNYRLNVAHELINRNRVTKNMNISEIAYEVGFSDPKYFTRCFTKRFGMAPRDLLGGCI